MFLRLIFISFFLIIIFTACSGNIQAGGDFYIRVNQVGFLPDDIKTAVILSEKNLEGKKVDIVERKSNKNILTQQIKRNFGTYGNFRNTYQIDFSRLKNIGEYYISIDGKKSDPFIISREYSLLPHP